MSGRAGAIVLAAGAASRFGSAKQVLLLPRVLRRLEPLVADGTLADVVVVEGAHPLPPVVPGARVVHCPDWADGPGASLRAGLAGLATREDVTAAVVVLADGPDLSPDAVRRVLAAAAEDEAVVAASYGGVRGHPLVVRREGWDAIPLEGLRSVRPRLVPCDDLGDPGDVDTPADLDRLRDD